MLDRGNRPERRTALITRELQLFGIEIAALQETRFEAQGHLQGRTTPSSELARP